MAVVAWLLVPPSVVSTSWGLQSCRAEGTTDRSQLMALTSGNRITRSTPVSFPPLGCHAESARVEFQEPPQVEPQPRTPADCLQIEQQWIPLQPLLRPLDGRPEQTDFGDRHWVCPQQPTKSFQNR